jgi:hypothetical protein
MRSGSVHVPTHHQPKADDGFAQSMRANSSSPKARLEDVSLDRVLCRLNARELEGVMEARDFRFEGLDVFIARETPGIELASHHWRGHVDPA